MTLDPPKSDAEYLTMLASKQLRGARSDTAQSAQLNVGTGHVIAGETEMVDGVLRQVPRKSSRMVLPAKGRSVRDSRMAKVLRLVRFTVPLSICISDNDKVMIHRYRRQIVLQPEYRNAKQLVQGYAQRAMDGAEPMEGPVEWHAVVYFANNRRDVQNCSKLLCDSCSKVVFRDDKQIVKAVWERGENDPENPRIEITVTKRSA